MKASLFVIGEGDDQLVPINGDLTVREDTPRNSVGVADLRYRYSIWPWSAVLSVQFVPTIIDAEAVVNVIDAGGNGGVGDWRPSAPKSLTGTFGRYEVQLSTESRSGRSRRSSGGFRSAIVCARRRHS
jgi:hypothetical protein